mgnify:CR=1 FL=1
MTGPQLSAETMVVLGRYGLDKLPLSIAPRRRSRSRLEQVRIGQTIVITYTEALAVSLEKTSPKAK